MKVPLHRPTWIELAVPFAIAFIGLAWLAQYFVQGYQVSRSSVVKVGERVKERLP